MIGQTAQPVTPKKLKNISGYDTSSNQEAVPVPYFAGVAKLALTWISPMYNLHKVTSGGQGGKKGVGASGSKDNWYADIAGVACICPNDAPVDFCLYVLVNDEIAFTGPLARSGGAHYAALTLDTYCQQARVYWGTKDSPTDNLILYPRQSVVPPGVDPRVISTWPALDAEGEPWEGDDPPPGVANPYAGHYDFHPAYRNNCYFVFKNFFLGSSPNMPNVAAVLARGCKFFGDTRLETTVAGVNPMGPAYELLTDKLIGAGMPESALDSASFIATKNSLNTSGIYVAPVLREAKPVRAWAAGFLENYDGFFCRDGSVLKAGYFDHGDIDQEGLLELDSNDIAGGEPNITPGTDEDIKTHFDVVFPNRLKWFTDDTESYRHLAAIEMLKVGDDEEGEIRPDRQRRDDIIDPQLAQRFVTERGMMLGSVGGGSGSNGFLWESVRDLLPGERFKLLSTSFGLTMLMRCTNKKGPAAGEGLAKLNYIVELADWDHIYIQPPAPKDEDFNIEAFAIAHARIVELPSPLKDAAGIQVAILAERPSSHVIGFRTYVSTDDETYDQVEQQSYFAVRAKIKAEDYPEDTDVVDTTVGMVVDLYGRDLATIVSQSDQQRDDMTLLVWAGNEIMSVGEIEALGDGRFRVYLRRGCYGSVQAAHSIDDEVWFVFRSQVNAIGHAIFDPGATVYFKLQSYTATQNIDLAEADSIAHTFGDGPFLLNNLEIWGQGEDYTFEGRNPRFRWSLYDISGLGIIGVPGVPPAAFNEDTGLWHDLIATGTGENIIGPAVRAAGSLTAPVTGAPAVWNPDTALWHTVLASGTGENILVGVVQAGSATPPTGGVPILFNPDNELYYRIAASGTGENILLTLDTGGLSVGGGSPFADQFVRFELRARDPVSGDSVWTANSAVPEYIFSYEENVNSTDGRRREFHWGVRAVYRKHDGALGYTDWLEILVSNPQSHSLGGTAQVGADRIDYRFIEPAVGDLDYAGIAMWRSLDPDFEVEIIDGNLPPGVELIHDGSETSFSVPQPPASTWYYRFAIYDVFSPSDHNSQAFFDDVTITVAVARTTP